jgi:hypothetical protein
VKALYQHLELGAMCRHQVYSDSKRTTSTDMPIGQLTLRHGDKAKGARVFLNKTLFFVY